MTWGEQEKSSLVNSPIMQKVNQIAALNAHELLVATGGKGVYKLDVNTYMSELYNS